MRSTNSRGNTEIYMPKNKQDGAHKLGELSALASAREWERAALVALLVTNKSRGGRPKKNQANSRAVTDQFTIADFCRLGIYGLGRHESVRAYLKAWEISAFDTPVFGQKIELPAIEFPDTETLYGRRSVDDDDESPEEIDAADDTDETEDEDMDDDTNDVPSPRPSPRPRPQPDTTMLDQFLKVLDKTDPVNVIHGQPLEAIQLLIKTLESWVESLRDAAGESGLE